MASVASVGLVVDESGAIAGLTRFQQRAIDSFGKSRLAAAQLNAEIARTATAGTAAGNAMASGHDKANAHALTNLDTVRLLRDDLGVRIPRAMEKLIAQSRLFQSVAKVAFGALAIGGSLELAYSLASSIGGKFEEWAHFIAGDTKAMQDLHKSMVAANDQLLMDPKNTDQAQANIQLMINTIKVLTKAKEDASKPSIGRDAAYGLLPGGGIISAVNQMRNANKNETEIIKDADIQGAATAKMSKLDDEYNDKMRRQSAETTEVTLDGLYKVAAAHKAAYDDVEVRLARKELTLKQAAAERDSIDQKSAADASVISRKYANEVRDAWMKSAEARVQGEQLAYRAMEDAEKKWAEQAKRDGITAGVIDQHRSATVDGFDSERDRRLKSQMDEAMDSQRRAQQAALTEVPRILAEHADEVDKINDRVRTTTLDPKAADVMRTTAQMEMNNKLLAIQREFNSAMKAMDDERVDESLKGYGKIDAEERKAVATVQDRFSSKYAGAAPGTPGLAEAAQTEQDEITKIHEQSERQRQLLSNRNADETLKYDEQAAQAERRVKESGLLGWVATYQNTLTEIEGKESAHTKILEAEFKSREIDQKTYEQRLSDVQRTANAEIEEQNIELRHKLTGAIEAGFKDPWGTIKSEMKHQMAQVIADWLMQLSIFKTLSTMSLGGILHPGAGGVGSIPGTRGVVPGSPNLGKMGTYEDIGSPGGVGSNFTGSGTGSTGSYGGSLPGMGGAVPQFPAGSGPSISVSGTSQALLAGGSKFGRAGLGGYALYRGTRDAFTQGNPLSGAVGDAAAGAAIGSVIPGLGTAIGGAIGGGIGAAAGLLGMVTGESGRLGAREYYRKTLFPEIEQDRLAQSGDFQTAIANVNRTAADGMLAMRKQFGGSAADWVNDNYLKKEVSLADSQISARASGGAQYIKMSASQFHSGGYLDDFGSLATSSTEGYIHGKMGESIVNQAATTRHAPVINAMNDGASPKQIAAMYGADANDGGDHLHLHLHTMEPASFEHFLRNGGARTINKHLNNFAGQYSGDGISG
jgi:hypothetical protein